MLHLTLRAATEDGELDLVRAREADRSLLMHHLDARLAGKKLKFPLPIRRFRQLRLVWEGPTLYFDDKLWPGKKHEPRGPSETEITVRPSALLILQLAATVGD